MNALLKIIKCAMGSMKIFRHFFVKRKRKTQIRNCKTVKINAHSVETILNHISFNRCPWDEAILRFLLKISDLFSKKKILRKIEISVSIWSFKSKQCIRNRIFVKCSSRYEFEQTQWRPIQFLFLFISKHFTRVFSIFISLKKGISLHYAVYKKESPVFSFFFPANKIIISIIIFYYF